MIGKINSKITGLMVLVAVLVLSAGGAMAATSYTISGTVTDSGGTAIGNATVTAYHNGTQIAQTTTASDGTYSLSVTGGQSVKIVIDKSGFAETSKTYSSLSSNKTFSPSLSADSDGDEIADSSDAYPSYARLEFTVDANDSKTVSSIYAEINSTNEVTVTVLHNGTQLAQKTVTPSNAPKTVGLGVSDYDTYTVHVHGVSQSAVSSTGAFYGGGSTGGVTGGGSGNWVANNPFAALLAGIVVVGAAAVAREEFQ